MNNSYIKEGSSGTMHLTCECYGSSGSRAEEVDNDALISSTKKKRNTPSKKCGCPYDIKIYVLGVPTTFRKGIETISFDTGVYIYEYPKAAHTCCCQTIQKIVTTFQDDVVYNRNSETSENLVKDARSEDLFCKHAILLYRSGVPQDKAYQLLVQIGIVNTAKLLYGVRSNYIELAVYLIL